MLQGKKDPFKAAEERELKRRGSGGGGGGEKRLVMLSLSVCWIVRPIPPKSTPCWTFAAFSPA